MKKAGEIGWRYSDFTGFLCNPAYPGYVLKRMDWLDGSKFTEWSYLEKNSFLIFSTGISFPVQRRNASAPW